MAIDGINITLAQVSATSEQIKKLNTELDMKLEEIKKEMNALEATWQSEAARTIRANFGKTANKFPEYKKIIDSYAVFLDKTVEAYTKTETAINNNANAFL